MTINDFIAFLERHHGPGFSVRERDGVRWVVWSPASEDDCERVTNERETE